MFTYRKSRKWNLGEWDDDLQCSLINDFVTNIPFEILLSDHRPAYDEV